MLSIMLLGCGRPSYSGISALPNIRSFKATTIDGTNFTEKDLAKYDLTIINIWATYCSPCVREMPDLAKLEKSLPDNIQFITVCTDASTRASRMFDILDEAGYTGMTLISFSGDLLELVRSTRYIPTSVFVDSKGNIVVKELVGSPKLIEESYHYQINRAFENMGKEPIYDI